MMSEILMILLTWLGFTFHDPNDLRRRDTLDDHKCNLNFWVIENMDIVAGATIIIVLTIFTIFCFWIVGVSATDSGLLYNQLDKVI